MAVMVLFASFAIISTKDEDSKESVWNVIVIGIDLGMDSLK